MVVVLLFCGAGCLPIEPTAKVLRHLAPAKTAARYGTWSTVAPDAERAEFLFESRQGTIVVYRFSPERYAVSIAAAGPKSVTRWLTDMPDAALVINGVYFNDDERPTGFAAIAGASIGTVPFDQDKSGMMVFSPKFRIVATKTAALHLNDLADAAQSYPFFLIDGQPAISADSGQLARRTFIGQDADDRIYIGAVADADVSLYELMQALQRTGIAWGHALNLDGGPSTGIAERFSGHVAGHDSFVGVPNVIVVSPRE